jgi:hypothetical protein
MPPEACQCGLPGGVLMTKQRTSSDAFRFNGFQSPNYTIVPDELFDELLTELTGAELKALLYIIRRTFGFKKDADSISLAQMMNGITTHDGHTFDRGAGLSKPTLLQALRSLQEKNIITTERRRSAQRGDEPTVYRLKLAGEPRGKESIPPVVKKFDQGGGQRSLPGPWSKNLPTQETVDQETEKQDVVVARDALKDFGLSDAVAAQLAATYPEAYLLAKLDLVRWLVESHSPLVARNPAGYLRRAIEQDYAAPAKYQTPDERRAAAEAEQAAIVAEQEQRRQAEVEYAEEKAQHEQELRDLYPPQRIPGTDSTTTQLWEQALERLRAQIVGLAFDMFLKNTVLVRCSEGQAVIVAPARFNTEYLASRLDPSIRQTLSQLLGQPVTCQYVPRREALTVADDPTAGGQPLSIPSKHRGIQGASSTEGGGAAGNAEDNKTDGAVAPPRAADQASLMPRRGRTRKASEDLGDSYKLVR